MADIISTQVRIGAANIKVDAVGGAFSSPTDLGKTSADGITITYENSQAEISSAQETTLEDIFDIGPERLTMEAALKAHTMINMALSFGQAQDDVTDNSSDTPKNHSIFVGGWKATQYYAVQLKVPQAETPTLYDIYTLYKVKFVAAYNQAFTIRSERYIPVKLICVADADHSGRYGEIELEYTVSA